MAAGNVQDVHLKLQMLSHVDFFEVNQAQGICENPRIFPSLQEEFVNVSTNRQISYIETGKQSQF